jgi:hypothetical protein
LGVGVSRPQDSCEATKLLLFLDTEDQPTEIQSTEIQSTEIQSTEIQSTEIQPRRTEIGAAAATRKMASASGHSHPAL